MIDEHLGEFIMLSEQYYKRLWLDQWGWIGSHVSALALYAADTDIGIAEASGVSAALETYDRVPE